LSIGTRSGGRSAIRSFPSSRWVSFSSARRLSLLRALARFFSSRRLSALLACPSQRATTSSTSSREYQTSSSFIAANSAIAAR